MNIPKSHPPSSIPAVAGVLLLSAFVGCGGHPSDTAAEPREPPSSPGAAKSNLILTDAAIANLGLKAKRLAPQTYWKTVVLPGMVVDRPGRSDRGVPAPATGVVSRIHRTAGDFVRPGEVLFTLHLVSESLHLTQTELFRATQEVKLAEARVKRLAASAGAVPDARRIEVEDQISRQLVALRAYRQELLNRGLSAAQIDHVAAGDFVRELSILAPRRPAAETTSDVSDPTPAKEAATPREDAYEIQEVKVELGQQVEAGRTLCLLADHHDLAIEGKAFRDEIPLLENCIQEGTPLQVDFLEDSSAPWPPVRREFRIRYLANSVDPGGRTFAFLLPLENQSRTVERDGRTQLLQRFRPGQRVRIHAPLEKLEGVLVMPAEGVAREAGGERYVFTQNANTFERRAVRVLRLDRTTAVLADDGALPRGAFVVQSAAAVLDRLSRAPTAAAPSGFHVHADGSLHQNSDEGK